MFHHITVHFPIALLLVAGGVYLYSLFRPENPYSPSAFLLHILGTLGIGASLISGDLVKGERTFADAQASLLKQHEILAYVMLWLFGMLLLWRFLRQKKNNKNEQLLFSLLFCAGLLVLCYSAYIGGKLS